MNTVFVVSVIPSAYIDKERLFLSVAGWWGSLGFVASTVAVFTTANEAKELALTQNSLNTGEHHYVNEEKGVRTTLYYNPSTLSDVILVEEFSLQEK